jgi:hypothetical protein
MKKKYNISKLLLIFFLFAIPIYILYFNESENSKSILNLNETLKESYNNYVNVCKNGEIPEFYNINNATPIPNNFIQDGSGCNYYCNDNSLCSFYVTDNSNTICNLYSGDSSTKVTINCASKYQNDLPNKLKTIAGLPDNFNYDGIGFVKDKFYYTDGSNAFTYNDVILTKANAIKSEIIDIQDKINNSPDDDSIQGRHREIEIIKDSLAKYLDISMGNLFSTLSIGLNTFNTDAKTMKFDPNTDNLDEKRDISINPLFNTFKDLNKSLINVDGNQEFNELEYNRRYLVYSILLFLSVISIIILLLHKFVPNLISNITLMAYFIGIILIISFIHFILKQ